MSKKSFIDSVDVKSPCNKDWEEMLGTERIRFCEHCSKSVTNLSAITRKEALRVVRASGGDICIRFIKDPILNEPIFADRLYQIARRAPRLAAGMMSASLSLSTMAYAQSPAPTQTNSVQAAGASADTGNEDEETSDPSLGSIAGTVWDSAGKPVPNLSILLVQSAPERDTEYGTTQEDGSYRFDELEPGTYTLRIHTKGGVMKKATRGKELSVGQNMTLDLHVTLVPPAEEDSGEIGFGFGGAVAVIEYSLPLSRAVSNEDLEETANLLAEGAKVNDKDENYSGITPLFLAVETGSLEMVQLLLKHGADPNAVDDNGRTPLMFIDNDATPELIRAMVIAGARVNMHDESENTVLLSGAGSVNSETLKALIEAGADVNAFDKEGVTALMKVADDDELDQVVMLVAAGADVNAKNKNGETAWDKTSSVEVEEYLIAHGAIADYYDLVVTDPSEPEVEVTDSAAAEMPQTDENPAPDLDDSGSSMPKPALPEPEK